MPDINMQVFKEAKRNQLITEVDIQTQVALNDYQAQLSDIANPTQSQDNVVVDRFGEFLPHWNESLDFDTWVKMSMEVAGKRILMLHGNSSINSVSNGNDVFNTFISHEPELSWVKYASNPIISLGGVGAWDEKAVYVGVLPVDISTGEPILQGSGSDEYWVFYSGGADTTTPRHETSIGLAKSTDYKTPVKYGSNPVINRTDVGLGAAGKGIMVMDIKYFNSKYYMFIASNHAADDTRISMMESTDLLSWSNYTEVLTANDRDHAPFVIEDPNDNTKLIMYYAYIPTGLSKFRIGRATANKATPYIWTEDSTNNPILIVTDNSVIYPYIEHVDGTYYLYYTKYTDSLTKTKIFLTSNTIDTSFSDTGNVIITYGASGEWDDDYVSVARKYTDGVNDWIYYTARKDPSDTYTAVGVVEWKLGNGTLSEWDVVNDPVDVGITHAFDGTYGLEISGVDPATAMVQKNVNHNNAIYQIWIYDDGTTTTDFQNMFRLYDSSNHDPLIGIHTPTSTTHYVYRAEGGSFTTSSVARSNGWHVLKFVVKSTTTDVYIDDTLIFTETGFDESNVASIRSYGYKAGIAYSDVLLERKYAVNEPTYSIDMPKNISTALKSLGRVG